jgi:hypothetical protein
MSLARASDDLSHKQRYEDLALGFARSAVGERDPDITATVKRKPDSGNASPRN